VLAVKMNHMDHFVCILLMCWPHRHFYLTWFSSFLPMHPGTDWSSLMLSIAYHFGSTFVLHDVYKFIRSLIPLL